MVANSTSISWLNADRRLTKAQKVVYLLANWVSNQFPRQRLDTSLVLRHFRCLNWNEYWSRLDAKTSPARRLSDLFWAALPWEAIQNELQAIRIVDTGCGDGLYAERLSNFSHGRVESYFGIDHREHARWRGLKERHPNFEFRVAGASALPSTIPVGSNMFITQSALEHIDGDLSYFEALNDYIRKERRPVLQVHLLPSEVCLKLYLWHGVRQYTPRKVSKITKMFRDNSQCVLYSLGGKACNDVYWNFVTKPLRLLRTVDYRETRTEEYERLIRSAIEKDVCSQEDSLSPSPSFYALVIQSNFEHKPFG